MTTRNNLDSARILLKRNEYSKKMMSPSTRKLYEKYKLSEKENEQLMMEGYEILKSRCISLNDSYPLSSLLRHIKEYGLYDKLEEVFEIMEEALKNRTFLGMLNIYDAMFQMWYASPEKKDLSNVSDYLDLKVQELFYMLTLQTVGTDGQPKEIDKTELKEQEIFVLNRCKTMIETLHSY